MNVLGVIMIALAWILIGYAVFSQKNSAIGGVGIFVLVIGLCCSFIGLYQKKRVLPQPHKDFDVQLCDHAWSKWSEPVRESNWWAGHYSHQWRACETCGVIQTHNSQ